MGWPWAENSSGRAKNMEELLIVSWASVTDWNV